MFTKKLLILSTLSLAFTATAHADLDAELQCLSNDLAVPSDVKIDPPPYIQELGLELDQRVFARYGFDPQTNRHGVFLISTTGSKFMPVPESIYKMYQLRHQKKVEMNGKREEAAQIDKEIKTINRKKRLTDKDYDRLAKIEYRLSQLRYHEEIEAMNAYLDIAGSTPDAYIFKIDPSDFRNAFPNADKTANPRIYFGVSYDTDPQPYVTSSISLTGDGVAVAASYPRLKAEPLTSVSSDLVQKKLRKSIFESLRSFNTKDFYTLVKGSKDKRAYWFETNKEAKTYLANTLTSCSQIDDANIQALVKKIAKRLHIKIKTPASSSTSIIKEKSAAPKKSVRTK